MNCISICGCMVGNQVATVNTVSIVYKVNYGTLVTATTVYAL